jgi:hypothetical protein
MPDIVRGKTSCDKTDDDGHRQPDPFQKLDHPRLSGVRKRRAISRYMGM